VANGVTDFLASLASTQFEKARAKLQAQVGTFFTYRDKLLQMRDRVDYLARKAGGAGNAALATAVKQVAPQIDAAYNNQVQLEGQVQSVLSQVVAIQQGGPGASLASMTSAAGSLVSVAAAVALHQAKVGGLESLVAQLENKSLTPAEIAATRAGGGFGAVLTAGTAVLVGGAAVVLFLLFGRKKR
jgi:hypothetical protein